jgi:hypothetical protein
MAHRTVESLLAQAEHMNAGTKRKHQTDSTLKAFGKSAMALRHALYQDKPVDRAEFLFMDSHMQVLEMAYLRWKRRHVWPADFH